jgi:hypothetical protein
MELIQKEQGKLEKRKAELEGQLAQRQLTQSQEARIRSFAEKISTVLDTLDFAGKQELMRLNGLKSKLTGNNRSRTGLTEGITGVELLGQVRISCGIF